MAIDTTMSDAERMAISRKREREKMIRAAERSASERQKVRDLARAEARASDCPFLQRALKMAEGGFGVLHITATGVDGAFVRRLVLGEVR
ncbi:MAG: hypothetical protein WAT93_13655 [Pontixanthobacter sp.]